MSRVIKGNHLISGLNRNTKIHQFQNWQRYLVCEIFLSWYNNSRMRHCAHVSLFSGEFKNKKIKIKIQKVALWKMPYTRIKIINIPAASLPRKRKNVQVCQSQSVGHVIHSLPAGTETLSWLIFQHLQKQEQQMKD